MQFVERRTQHGLREISEQTDVDHDMQSKLLCFLTQLYRRREAVTRMSQVGTWLKCASLPISRDTRRALWSVSFSLHEQRLPVIVASFRPCNIDVSAHLLVELSSQTVVAMEQRRTSHGLARILSSGERVYEDEYTPNSILLTGGAGFIGSHVATLLAKKYPNYKVTTCPPCADDLMCDHFDQLKGFGRQLSGL